MSRDAFPDHYATLGLGRKCTAEEIRTAYRVLAKKYHPDLNPGSPEAHERLQALNEANEVLSDPARRAEYDREAALREPVARTSTSRIKKDVSQDVFLSVEDFFRGVELEVKVNDPANRFGNETYPLTVPEDTAPGTRFCLPRDEPFQGGHVIVRVKPRPSHRFKVRGSDLRADLRISAQRAAQGGTETMPGATGRMVRVQIPEKVARGEVIKVPGEGLPKPRGGRGDLLVRIDYRPEVRVSRGGGGLSRKAPLRIDSSW